MQYVPQPVHIHSAFSAPRQTALRSPVVRACCPLRLACRVHQWFPSEPVFPPPQTKCLSSRPTTADRPQSRSQAVNVRRLWSLASLSNLVLDFLPFTKRLESLPLNTRVMNKQIVAAVIRSDKTEPLPVIKPFYLTLCHSFLLVPPVYSTSCFRLSLHQGLPSDGPSNTP
jgi:hypothetical protein